MISEIYEKKFSEGGYEVLTADSGEKVLTLAKQGGVNSILLDIILPKMNGLEILKKLRTENYDPGIRIIMCSNMSQEEERKKADELGADGFLVKSEYSPSDLVKEVTRLLNQFNEEEKNNGVIINSNIHGEPLPADNPSKTGRILMIEDEEVFQEIFGEKLRQSGYNVDFASDGSEGLKKALEGEYSLFIIDYMLPGITGEEIAAKLKLDDKTKDVPVVILSASADDSAQKRLEDMGVTAFYVKTQIIPSELTKKVEEILK